jgi:hypothetical protein
MLLCESESYVTTDSQSGSLSWYKAPIRGLRPDFFFPFGIRNTFLIPWGALSDERMGLAVVCAAGPFQRSLSPVLVPWDVLSYDRTGLSFVCAAGPCQRSLLGS